ncbi:MAG: hypothetical protein FJW39_26190 [Acidobacteria bacterium]|nr:hypothetical protein [Acidobacteriota bacterium]
MEGNFPPPNGVYTYMKYWSYFIAKVVAVACLLTLIWRGLHAVWPDPSPVFAQDLEYTFAVMFLSLFGFGLLYLSALDQRYRCRTCLRRLRMPVSFGTFNHVLLGAPRTDYICPWGHGTLRVSEVPFASPEKADWHAIDDMWKELYELEETKR